MSEVVFLVGDLIFKAPIDPVVANCTIFQNNPILRETPYRVRASVSAEVFSVFLSIVVNGGSESICVNESTVVDLSILCGEFGFWSFCETLSNLISKGNDCDITSLDFRRYEICESLRRQEQRLARLENGLRLSTNLKSEFESLMGDFESLRSAILPSVDRNRSGVLPLADLSCEEMRDELLCLRSEFTELRSEFARFQTGDRASIEFPSSTSPIDSNTNPFEAVWFGRFIHEPSCPVFTGLSPGNERENLF
jgi:hypothetical protein